MNEFGDLLREMRVGRGITQAELADAAGTTQSRISQYEKGHVQPNADTRRRLAEALDVDPLELDPHFAERERDTATAIAALQDQIEELRAQLAQFLNERG